MRGSASISSGSLGIVTESRMAGVQTLLVSVLFALAAAGCGGGQGREVRVVEVVKEVPVEVTKVVIKEVPVEVVKEVPVKVPKEVIEEAPVVVAFPQHDEQILPDRGREFFAGKLVLKEGCLRAEAPPRSGHDNRSKLIVWPRSFTLNTEDGSVRVVDATGRIAARVGDHVRFGGYPSGPQSVRLRELEQELPTDCPGPYLWAGEVTAISLGGPTTLTLELPDSELHFLRQETILGGQESLTALAIGELVLDGQCLRLKGDTGHGTSIIWPPGFTPHYHRGLVHVRNGAGRIIAQVGDELAGGGGYSARGDEKCPGPSIGINDIKVLPDVEVYFPKQDGSLAIDQEMESFVGRLVLDRKCLKVDSVRDRDRVVFPVPPLLIWPDTFTLSTEDEVVGIVDAAGRTVARVGEDVQFSAADVSYGQAMERSGLREISPACSGPYWVVADDFTAVPDSESP